MDTDSAYIAFTHEKFEDNIKEDMKQEYLNDKYNLKGI